MRAILGGGHATVADFQHVRIVPTSRAGIRLKPVLKIENVDHAHAAPIAFTIPTVLYVARRAPEIADAPGPQPRLRRAPLTDTKNDRPPCFRESVAHNRVRRRRILSSRGAPVVLQVIHTPRSILARVLKFVSTTARALLASESSGIGIDSKLQSFRMNVIGERFHSGRKSLRIGEDVSLCVSIDLPAIVDHEVNVTGVSHAAGYHRIRHFLDQLLADIAGKLVPTVPTHRRRLGETVIEGTDVSETKRDE